MIRILLFVVIYSVSASAEVGLKVYPPHSQDAARLKSIYEKAKILFEVELGELITDTVIEIAPSSCLRTGYNRRSGSVVFCPNAKVINSGLDSIDVINHELFHAFLCQRSKEICRSDRDDLHEAMADVFAHRLNPDESFGENYYKDLSLIRPYKTDWRVGLVRSPHEKGLALASAFIKKRLSFLEMLPYFDEAPDNSVETLVRGTRVSSLNRYRLSPDEEIEIEFLFAPHEGELLVSFPDVKGLAFKRNGHRKFKVRNLSLSSSEKIRATFRDQADLEVGGMNFYLGPAI